MVRRVMGASTDVSGAFYAPRAGEGKQILPMKPSPSVGTVRGHTSQGSGALSQLIEDCDPTTHSMVSAAWKIAGLQVDRTPAYRSSGRNATTAYSS
jgi:hypothetical protein